MNKLSAFAFATVLATTAVSAKVSFSLDIEALTQGDGVTAISGTGLIVLVVDTGSDGFQLPSAGNLVNGNDEVVTYWDLNDYSFTSPDITLLSEGGVSYGNNWSVEDSLALFWFPTLSAANMTPATDTAFGVFSDSIGLGSGDGWKLPADGALLHSLKLFTSSASKLVMAGEFPNSIGKAAYAVGQSIPSVTAPSDIVLAASGPTIQVSWSGGSASNGGYLVQRRKSGTGDWYTVGVSEATESSFTDDYAIQPGANYEYRLLAVSGYASSLGVPELIQALRSRIIAFDSRAKMLTGVNKRTIDLSVTGTDELPVLLQAIGPSLHVTNSVPAIRPIPTDTALDLYYGIKPADVANRLIDSNDDWDLAADPVLLKDIMVEYGAYPMYDHPALGDSAFLALVKEVVGGYTAPVYDPTNSEGIAVVGIYDVDYLSPTPVDTRLTGVASRSFVGIGYENLRSSVNISGAVSMTLLVRAQGPWLRDLSETDQFNSETVLDNPTLKFYKLVSGAWVEIYSNDDWGTNTTATVAEIHAASDAVGLPRLTEGSADAAILVTLEPGIYHAIVEGVDNETGVAQIAMFEVPAL